MCVGLVGDANMLADIYIFIYLLQGAIREVRKDSQFLAKQKLQEQLDRWEVSYCKINVAFWVVGQIGSKAAISGQSVSQLVSHLFCQSVSRSVSQFFSGQLVS